jgi:hypothetical protein
MLSKNKLVKTDRFQNIHKSAMIQLYEIEEINFISSIVIISITLPNFTLEQLMPLPNVLRPVRLAIILDSFSIFVLS